MFDRKHVEIYNHQPYKRKPDGDVLGNLQARLNSNGRITRILPVPTKSYSAKAAFNRREFIDFYAKILDSEALMISNSRPVKLSFWSYVYVKPRNLIYPASYSILDNPHTAVLEYFSGSDEKDMAFVRRCLRESRFRLEHKKPKKTKTPI